MSFIVRTSFVFHIAFFLSTAVFSVSLSLSDRKHMLQLFPVSGEPLSGLHPKTHIQCQEPNSTCHVNLIFHSVHRQTIRVLCCVEFRFWMCYLHPDCGWCALTRCAQSWVQGDLWGNWPFWSEPGFCRCIGTSSPESRSGPWWELLVHLA